MIRPSFTGIMCSGTLFMLCSSSCCICITPGEETKKPSTSGTVHMTYDCRRVYIFEALASHIIPLVRDQAPQRLLARLPHPFRMAPDAGIIIACLAVQYKDRIMSNCIISCVIERRWSTFLRRINQNTFE